MNTVQIVLLVILIVLAAAVAGLYFWGKKIQKQQEEQQIQLENNKQTVNMLIIDKKMLRAKESGLPQAVTKSIPWYAKRSRLPIVKAKVGSQVVTLVAESKIFELIPVKKNVKAVVSGMYITDVKGLHGTALEKPQKKKSAFGRFMDRIQEKTGAKPIK